MLSNCPITMHKDQRRLVSASRVKPRYFFGHIFILFFNNGHFAGILLASDACLTESEELNPYQGGVPLGWVAGLFGQRPSPRYIWNPNNAANAIKVQVTLFCNDINARTSALWSKIK